MLGWQKSGSSLNLAVGIFLSSYFLFFLNMARAQSSPSPVNPPVIQSLGLGGQECILAVQRANQLCVVQVATIQGAGVNALAANTLTRFSESPSSMNIGWAAADGGRLGVNVNATSAHLCTEARTICVTQCQQALQTIEPMSLNTKLPSLIQDVANIKKTIVACDATFSAMAATYGAGAGDTMVMAAGSDAVVTAAAAQAGGDSAAAGVEDGVSSAGGLGQFLADHKKEIIAGVAGAGLGYMLGKKAQDENQDQSSKDKKSSRQSEAEKAKNANIPCGADEAYKNNNCLDQLAKECANVIAVGTPRCVNFTQAHCGFNTPSGTVNAAPGLGSQLCQDAMAQSYCSNPGQTEARKICYSCRNLVDRKTTTCQLRPEACMMELTNNEILQYKAQCPDDPINSTTKWSSITPDASGTGSTTVTDNSVTSGRILSDRSLSSLIGTQTTASSWPSDVSSRYGGSLLNRASAAIQDMCQRGELNSCGQRSGLSGTH